MFLLTEFTSDVKNSNLAYNAAVFVIFHPGIFKCSTRRMVRVVYEERFVVSADWHRQLDKWALNSDVCDDGEEDDFTTESEEIQDDWDDIYYDSYWFSCLRIGVLRESSGRRRTSYVILFVWSHRWGHCMIILFDQYMYSNHWKLCSDSAFSRFSSLPTALYYLLTISIN